MDGIIEMFNGNMNTILLFARHVCKAALAQKAFYLLQLLFLVLLLYSAATGARYMAVQNEHQQHFQREIRKSWEANPDKHPHRMAHFGSFALRIKHPLSLFDFGMENYAGNAVFLEAHKQNTVNYSEASFSTGLLRMGELSIAMLLQLILPLIIFFLGFSSVAADRENGTLKIISSQGVNIFSMLLGCTLGLWILSAFFFIPAFVVTALFLEKNSISGIEAESGIRFGFICMAYAVFYWIVSALSVAISATSQSSKNALIKLLGLWLLLAVITPKIAQVAANTLFPSPSKLQFETAIEKDIVRQGDSHNPDDPFFKRVKDSVFKKYGVSVADSLPVNLGGVIGKAGEQLSTETYIKHQDRLTSLYRQQNAFTKAFGWVNPFAVIKTYSMAFAGSDFEAYLYFQQQAESYRYALAQEMNDLQIQYVGNDKPKEGSHLLHIDDGHWKAFGDFQYKFLSIKRIIEFEKGSIIALWFWFFVSFAGLGLVAKYFKMII